MKSRRAITIGLTFIAGLYFVLDFIVPPTMPLATSQGVVASSTPASFSVQTNAESPIAYRFDAPSELRPQILLEGRDSLGKPKLTAVHLREVGPGSTVTVRLGPFMLKSIDKGSSIPIYETDSGHKFSLAAGQSLVNSSTGTPVVQPLPGDTLDIEQGAARITAVDPGSVVLIEHGARVTHPLGRKTVVLKMGRYNQGVEAQLFEVRVGDTIRMGPGTTFADNRDAAAQFNTVITTMAFGIGLISLGIVHSRNLVKRPPGWYVSIFFIGSVVLGVAAGVGKYYDPGTPSREFSDFVALRIIASVTSTVFSLLAFYMATAAYRAFRIKTREAALMMASALIVMIGQTPFGFYMTSWMGERFNALWLPNVAAWILRVPNTAMFRALIFGIMLGAIATALRYWLSMERTVSAGD